MRALGATGFAPARPTLEAILTSRRHVSLRFAAAESLLALKAWEPLVSLVDSETDRALLECAVAACFARDAAAAYDRLAPLLPSASKRKEVMWAVLARLPSAGPVVHADGRWAERLAPLSFRGSFAEAAERVLRHMGPGAMAARARAAPRKAMTPTRHEAILALAESYRPLGARIDALIAALRQHGYVFLNPEACRTPPVPLEAIEERIARLEGLCGRLPDSLIAFWIGVGGVSLRGNHPEWPWHGHADLAMPDQAAHVLTDPLEHLDGPTVLDELLLDHDPLEPCEELVFIADPLHKAGDSGDPEWGFTLPARSAEPRLSHPNEPTRSETLGKHIERALDWQGLPGFAALPDRPSAWLAKVAAAACVAL